MTKGVSLSTTTPKARDAVGPTAPASKPADDASEAGSFATLLDTAAPSRSDEREHDDRPEGSKAATEREQPHHHDDATTYLAPADLALAWLASRDVTPRSPKESGKAEDFRGIPLSPSNSGTDKVAPSAVDARDSEATAATAEGAGDAEEDGQISPAPLRSGTVAGTATEVSQSAIGTSSSPVASSGEHQSDAPSPLNVMSTRATNEADGSDVRLVSGSQPNRAQDRSNETPTKSSLDLAVRRAATLPAGDRVEQHASNPDRTSRARETEVRVTDRQSGAGSASTNTVPVMSTSAASQSRPGETAMRPNGASGANGAGQATSGAFVTANTELSAAVTKAQRGPDGSYHVTALLNPPSLGRVDVAIKVNGESVEVAITPHTAEGHEALSHHLDELQRELASEHTEVHLSLSDGGGQPRRGIAPEHQLVVTHAGDEVDVGVESHAPPPPDSSLHIIL